MCELLSSATTAFFYPDENNDDLYDKRHAMQKIIYKHYYPSNDIQIC